MKTEAEDPSLTEVHFHRSPSVKVDDVMKLRAEIQLSAVGVDFFL